MRNQVPAELVKTLSMNRAAAVRDALAEKYPNIDASRFYVDGLGWGFADSAPGTQTPRVR